MKTGKVYLVGAGPGDPGLITLRGICCLKKADVVIYDNLCNPQILCHAPSTAKLIFAGKHSGIGGGTQVQIDRLMLQHALKGRVVIRLKGGDPFVFGRGAEEACFLKSKKIPFEVIPGISSAIAVPGAAGIPVTHRDHAAGFAVITAYENPEKDEEMIDYRALARFPGTLVFLMGVKRVRMIVERLLLHGMRSRTTAALVRWGTRGIQEVFSGTLKTLPDILDQGKVRPPGVMVVGSVVNCRRFLEGPAPKPLQGCRVVLTRPREQMSPLLEHLRDLGAEPLMLPMIEIRSQRSRELVQSVKQIRSWDWVFLTSHHGAVFFLREVLRQHGDLRVLAGVKILALGDSIGEILRTHGIQPDAMPQDFSSMGILKWAKARRSGWKGVRILHPCSALSDQKLRKHFEKCGAIMEMAVAYQNGMPRWNWEWSAVEKTGVDMVVFTSASTVVHFSRLMKKRGGMPRDARLLFKKCDYISMGPSTSVALKKAGLPVAQEARPHSIKGLLAAIRRQWRG